MAPPGTARAERRAADERWRILTDKVVNMSPTGAESNDDEFAFLAQEAQEFGIAYREPDVHRVTIPTGTSTGDVPDVLSAVVWGAGPAQLALLHGGGLNAHTWDAFALAIDRPLVAVELPGHGDSSWRGDADYGAGPNAATIGPALEHLAPSAEAIVGQSLGGLTAIALAGSHPHLVRRLVIIDVSPGLKVEGGNQVRDFLAGPDSFESRDEIVERALSFGFGPSRDALVRGVFHNTRRRDDGRFIFKHHLANLRATGHASTSFNADFTGLWPALENATVPVLLVRGSRGFLSDAVADEFAQRVPGSRTVVIESGHNVQDEAPVALAEAISEFLAE
ncbi:MAG: alpha/beta hydrolase fold protein [Ilumatobacteraceae bacterium]|nr:alpha/beta hydrolase fold protein [Ilumatobacteraceae bacterium]